MFLNNTKPTPQQYKIDFFLNVGEMSESEI
jgi:hypothetical protein